MKKIIYSSIAILVLSIVIGTTYTITITTTGSGNKGFEVSPQDLSGNLLGTLIAGTGQKLLGGGKYLTHTTPKTGATAVWTFQWIAPAAGTGDVTFYGAFAITDKATKKSTLVISEAKPVVMPMLQSFMPMMARLNDTITITGKNFDTVISVVIGGVNAKSYSVSNDSVIKAVVDSCSDGKVVVTTTTGSSELAGFVFLKTTAGINFSKNKLVQVYPNPSSDFLFIQNKGLSTISKIEIYNLKGQLVLTPKNSNSIDITSLSNGQYYVIINTETSTYREVIIKR